MPENDFKKQAVRDCVCRVLESSGFPCVDPEAVKKNEEADETFKADCVTEAAANAVDPAKAAVEQRACLCDWAADVMPGLCNDASETRSMVAEIVEDCKKTAEKGKEDTCICNARAETDGLEDCKTAAEWDKVESAVMAKHATCGKVNRRRRGVPGPPVKLPPAEEEEIPVPEAEPVEAEEPGSYMSEDIPMDEDPDAEDYARYDGSEGEDNEEDPDGASGDSGDFIPDADADADEV